MLKKKCGLLTTIEEAGFSASVSSCSAAWKWVVWPLTYGKKPKEGAERLTLWWWKPRTWGPDWLLQQLLRLRFILLIFPKDFFSQKNPPANYSSTSPSMWNNCSSSVQQAIRNSQHLAAEWVWIQPLSYAIWTGKQSGHRREQRIASQR